MGRAKECDRCGKCYPIIDDKLYLKISEYIVDSNDNVQAKSTLDLCGSCYSEFMKFIAKGKGDNNAECSDDSRELDG